MKTILVPTDFSSVSKRAAEWAFQLAGSLSANRLILYNCYQAPVVIEPTMPTVPLMDFSVLNKISCDGLEEMKNHLLQQYSSAVPVDIISEFGVLSTSLEEVCSREQAELVVIGLSGGGFFDEMLMGSNALSVVKHFSRPVIVVPPEARFTPITTIVLASDLTDVATTTPVQVIHNLLTQTGAKLLVVHVNESTEINSHKAEEQTLLKNMLSDQPVETYLITDEDFVHGVNDFSEQHNADLIITIPKKHDFFERFFKSSHTKQLAFHSHIPLLCIHEAAQ